MWFEIIRWTSLVLLWVALTLNLIGIVRNDRFHKQLTKMLKDWQERMR